MKLKNLLSITVLCAFAVQTASAGISVVKSNGVSVSGADGVQYFGLNGVSVSGADGFLSYKANGVSVSGADGLPITSFDGVSVSGADGVTYPGMNGVSVSGADGVSISGADGVSVSGADGVSVSGADGTTYIVDTIVFSTPNGVSISGADGVSISGADGVSVSGADGVSVSGADGVSVSGADGVSVSGADSMTGFDKNGIVFQQAAPNGVSVSGADGVSVSGADGVSVSGADGVSVSGADSENPADNYGFQAIDPELAILLNEVTDDRSINAIIAFHNLPTEADFGHLRELGILGGTKFRVLPLVIVSATKDQLIGVSKLSSVRSIYGNRTLKLTSDPFLTRTGVQRIAPDADLRNHNSGFPVSGRNVTVAVLDTGVNSLHNDLSGRVVQNVRLTDTQSAPLEFLNPTPVENVSNTDPVNGHGTFVAGLIAGSGLSSGGKYSGTAPGAKILGLSAGDLNLTHVLAGFDYVLEKGPSLNVGVINCSFSSNTLYNPNDPVNIATKMLTDSNVSVVFSAGNTGNGNGTLNPYASAPWVISVGATNENAQLAGFSSRGAFGTGANPSLVAPGVNLVSLRSTISQTGVLGVAAGADSSRLTPGEVPFYTTASGTSFSAPQVAGAVALMLEANPTLSPAKIKDILQRSATPLPKYYGHEAGAGMLNTYAAVIEAAFPDRKTGLFRSLLSRNNVEFTTAVIRSFQGEAIPGIASTADISIPANTIQASVNIAWGGLLSPNDLGLKIYDNSNRMTGESNYLNLAGLTGKREEVVLNNPSVQTIRAEVRNTLPAGTLQTYFGSVEATTVEYPRLKDFNNLSAEEKDIALESLRSFLMMPAGNRFRADSVVSRGELAEAIVRSGLVPQYVAANRMFTDVNDRSSRSVIESVQSNPDGKLFFDAVAGAKFSPNSTAERLVAAVALVRAAGLEQFVSGAVIPPNVLDAGSVRSDLRGYVAIALQYNLMTTSSGKFNPGKGITRIELAGALVLLKNRS